MSLPNFTVFTPTFNRAHTLARVYDCLVSQTFKNFEWLIVDDGSTDETRALVMTWELNSPFEVRYIYQDNAGRHVADNRGASEARGAFYAVIESD